MNLQLLAALGLRCWALYLLWKSLGFLMDYFHASMIYDNLRPGTGDNGSPDTLEHLHSRYGDGVSLQLCHTIFGYFAGYLLAAILLWYFSISIARFLTKNLETL